MAHLPVLALCSGSQAFLELIHDQASQDRSGCRQLVACAYDFYGRIAVYERIAKCLYAVILEVGEEVGIAKRLDTDRMRVERGVKLRYLVVDRQVVVEPLLYRVLIVFCLVEVDTALVQPVKEVLYDVWIRPGRA